MRTINRAYYNSSNVLLLFCFVLQLLHDVKCQIGDHYMKIGACQNVVTGSNRCAMEPSECRPSHIDSDLNPEGETWLNAYTLEQRGVDEECTCKNTQVGHCTDPHVCAPRDNGYCDIDPENSYSSTWRPLVGLCECQSTQFGACQDTTTASDHFCAYSNLDCESEFYYIWVEPPLVKEITGLDCGCEKVRIGGCVGGHADFHCALTPSDCTWDTYYPPVSLENQHREKCYLCEPPPTGMVATTTSPGAAVAAVEDMIEGLESDGIDRLTNDAAGLNTNETAIIIVALAVTCALLLSLLGFAYYKRVARPKKSDPRYNDGSDENAVPEPFVEVTDREIT